MPDSTQTDAVRLTRLPSGLTVVTERMDRVETVSFGAYVATGSRHETEAENGVSHFLEHMAFKGTERRSAAKIAEEMDAVGGHLNAYTAREQTAYYAKVLKEDTALAADIIGDILTHSTFDPEELERERGVILQEIGQANDTPDDIIFDYFQEQAYPAQSLGRPVLGSEETVRAMSRTSLMGYMRRHYPASNVVVAAAGAIEHDQIVDLVQTHFADLAADPAPSAPAGRYQGGEFREDRDLDQVHIVLGFPSVAYDDPDFHPTLLLSTLLGGGMSSRLFQEVREKRGLVYSIYSFNAPLMDGGLLGIYAGTGESEAQELIPVTLDELRKVQHEVTDAELSRARAQAKAGLLMSLESTGSRCEQLARQIQVFGRVVPVAETVAKINAVDRAAIQRAAARHFRAAPTLAVLGPGGQVPSLASVAETLAG
ncbi:MAG TPA: pitrilysin family protein [Acetobacteraceae bacterium]